MANNDNNDFNYVEQKIKSKNKKRLRKALEVIALSAVAALIFGFVARIAFSVSETPVIKLLGITPTPTQVPVVIVENQRNEVTIGSNKPSAITPTANPTPTEQPVQIPDEVTIAPAEVSTPTPTELPQPTGTAEDNGDGDKKENNTESALETYMKMMAELRSVAENASKSIVRVYAVTSGVNWMDESIESKTERTGLVMADNGIELLILTNYAAVYSADRIEIEFSDDTILEGTLYSGDPDTGLAVISVELSEISEKTIKSYSYISVGSSTEVYEGEPVIAIGRPNGNYGSVEFGFISHTGSVSYFTDGVLEQFSTDIVSGSDADGVVLDLGGRVIGFIPAGDSAGITVSASCIDSMRLLLYALLNGNEIPFIGVRTENMPADILTGMGLENGIYVNEVISGSPAAEAGIKKGDVIVAIDGQTLNEVSEFYEYLLCLEKGQTVSIDIYHSSMRDEPAENIKVIISSK